MRKAFLFLTIFLVAGIAIISSCQTAEPDLAAIPTVAELAQVETLPPEQPTAEAIPVTFTPAAEATQPPPTATVQPPAPEQAPTEQIGNFNRGGTSMPSLLPQETPLPTITASPAPTLPPPPTLEVNPLNPSLPPFETGPVTRKFGSGFGNNVRNNDRLDYVKIGFHDGPGGSAVGIVEWMTTLDSQGIPFFLKSADDAGTLFQAQELSKKSGVPHILVFRRSGGDYELPNYFDDPTEAAQEHWQKHLDAFPPELDKSMVWIESANEVDRGRSEWMARYSLEIAKMAVRDGYKYAAFGWSSGEPEYTDWQAPEMEAFLRFAADHPNQVAVSLHEYSYKNEDLFYNYPFQVGRFQLLFLATDRMGIRRPTVLITEFGWEYVSLPSPEDAMAQMTAVMELYAKYPEVKGAAIWYLGGGYSNIPQKAQRLFQPLTTLSTSAYYERPTYPPIEPEIFLDYWEKEGITP